MKEPNQVPTDGFNLTQTMKRLRNDDNGSLTLLAGMMVFLVTIFAIIGFDTNMAIYDRVISQNAADAAADSAALWEARACNLLQELNNIHYDVDILACSLEGVAAVGCVLAVPLDAAEIGLHASGFFYSLGEFAKWSRYSMCTICDTLPYVDMYQNKFYNAVITTQKGIVGISPYISFAYANSAAAGCGASSGLPVVIANYLSGAAQRLSTIIPGLGGISSLAKGLANSVGILGHIDLYAMPLDPSDFGLIDPTTKGLHVTQRANNGWPPLYWPEFIGATAEKIGYGVCSSYSADVPFADMIPSPLIGTPWWGYFDDAMDTKNDYTKEGPGNQTWGWNDSYYYGWPGYSTWVSGTDQKNELLGLGNLSWLNGGQNGDTNMFTNSATGAGSGSAGIFQIPAFIAFASSQVQGSPVICHGDVNAQGTLIKVYFPFGGSPTSGEDYYIYH
jgi:hypothetical protein